MCHVIHFANKHACMTFWTHSWTTTKNSKPDSPYQPACLRSVTCGLRSVRLCMASALWCWMNWWNVWQKLKLCWLRHLVHTKVTWSPWLPFMISFFNRAWHRAWTVKPSQQSRWQHVQPLRFHVIQNIRATTVTQSQQQVNCKLICGCLNLHIKVWNKIEKAFCLWSGWH